MGDAEIQSTMPALETFSTVDHLRRFSEENPNLWGTLSKSEKAHAIAKVTLLSEGYQYDLTTDRYIGPQLQRSQIVMVGDTACIVEKESADA